MLILYNVCLGGWMDGWWRIVYCLDLILKKKQALITDTLVYVVGMITELCLDQVVLS